MLGTSAERVIPRWREALTRGLTIFIFHEVTATPSEFLRLTAGSVHPDLFRAQASWIQRRFTVVAPTDLPQLGAELPLPGNAALLTFDDAWEGTFRTALPILQELGLPALCFVNMGTVAGDPDLAAVRRYRSLNGDEPPSDKWDRRSGARYLDEVKERYDRDPAFSTFQGPTVGAGDLARAAEKHDVWFGSHLYHHWDLRRITGDLFEESFDRNRRALEAIGSALPVFATPHGFAGDAETDVTTVPRRFGTELVLTGKARQNDDPASPVLDRLYFPGGFRRDREWWYATHRRRLLGPFTGTGR